MASKQIFCPLDINSATKYHALGTVRREFDTATDECFKTFKYVKASGAIANGTALTFYDSLGTIATYRTNATANAQQFNQPAGVGQCTITSGYYGWIQIGGYHSAVKTNGDDDIADGANLVMCYETDGVVDSIAAGTASSAKMIGVAVAADSDDDDTVAALLCCDYADVIQ